MSCCLWSGTEVARGFTQCSISLQGMVFLSVRENDHIFPPPLPHGQARRVKPSHDALSAGSLEGEVRSRYSPAASGCFGLCVGTASHPGSAAWAQLSAGLAPSAFFPLFPASLALLLNSTSSGQEPTCSFLLEEASTKVHQALFRAAAHNDSPRASHQVGQSAAGLGVRRLDLIPSPPPPSC